MKTLTFYAACISMLALTACSRSFENKETTYESNVKGFFNANDEDNMPVFTMLTLEKVTDDWDGGGKKPDFEPKESTDKLIKVELKGATTDSQVDLGITEANLELYDSKSKKTYAPIVSMAAGSTFKGAMDNRTSGYVVYSVPTETNVDDLYIGINKELKTSDLSKVEIATLLPLKKADALKENVITINESKKVNDIIFDVEKTYTFSTLTVNCNDDKVAKDRKDGYKDASTSYVKLSIEVSHGSTSSGAYIDEPWLVTEYGIVGKNYEMGEFPMKLEPGETVKMDLYYEVPAGAKIIGLMGENMDGSDYAIELK